MFALTIETDNDAFVEDETAEVRRILKNLIDAMEQDEMALSFDLRDLNGNKVGTAVRRKVRKER